MNSSLLELVMRSSSLSLGELNARMSGDAEAVAVELASLAAQGFVTITVRNPSNTLNDDNAPDQLQTIFDSQEQANNVFVSATASGFKNFT